ncbi:MAG: MBL fold metallo-hydrolase [Wenzhouxiangellaceae bacterium]
MRRLGWLLISTLPLIAGAQDFSKVEINSQYLAGQVSMLTGRGGNVAVAAGADGVFLIDDQYAPLSDKIIAAVRQISDQPIRYIINTHWHHDHTGGNENFAAHDVAIIAHDNVRERLRKGQLIEFVQRQLEPAPAAALPVLTFNDEMSLHLNGESVRIHHIPHGHTDGDAIVHFPASNVIHMGDLFFNGGYPFIDLSSGGHIDGVIKGAAMALELADADTRIIPGHGPLAGRDDLQAYHDMLTQVRDAVALHVSKGDDLATTLAAQPTAALDADWGQGYIEGEQLLEFVWQSLTSGSKSSHHK